MSVTSKLILLILLLLLHIITYVEGRGAMVMLLSFDILINRWTHLQNSRDAPLQLKIFFVIEVNTNVLTYLTYPSPVSKDRSQKNIPILRKVYCI